VIESLADLRPGDIMFAPIGGLVPGLFPVGLGQLALGEVFRVGRLSVRHVGIVVEASQHLPAGSVYRGVTYETGVITAPRLVQAMPGGAEEIELRIGSHWTPRHAYLRLPEDYPGQAEDAAAIARLMVKAGTPYSFASYASLALWRWGVRVDRLERWINRHRSMSTGLSYWSRRHDDLVYPKLPVEAICSVLVDQAWTLAGKDVMPNTAEQAVTPGALANQLWRTPGAIWGLP
jgi:cell wall-associated NlpC family hydrolase